MRSFYYRPWKNALVALGSGIFALITAKTWWEHGGFTPLVGMLLFGAVAAKCTFDGMSREPALKFDDQSIWIRKVWGGIEQVPWRDVHDVSAKVFTMRYMGVIPISRTAYITVTCEGGLTGARRLRVSTTALGLSPAATAELLFALKKAHADAVGEVGVAMAAAGSHGWGVGASNVTGEPETASGFDADAAIARYLASKQSVSSQAAPPAAGAQPPVPQRPVFGRRVG
jgi:hypothetical protein